MMKIYKYRGRRIWIKDEDLDQFPGAEPLHKIQSQPETKAAAAPANKAKRPAKNKKVKAGDQK